MVMLVGGLMALMGERVVILREGLCVCVRVASDVDF